MLGFLSRRDSDDTLAQNGTMGWSNHVQVAAGLAVKGLTLAGVMCARSCTSLQLPAFLAGYPRTEACAFTSRDCDRSPFGLKSRGRGVWVVRLLGFCGCPRKKGGGGTTSRSQRQGRALMGVRSRRSLLCASMGCLNGWRENGIGFFSRVRIFSRARKLDLHESHALPQNT